ncbi:helix-turn-helix domain-containing protein [Thermaerobacillus caldiproteolyticus]|uniref:hypothetical protein n=1 Tax=Thermaerobacillus caldiproteolyticus TaxID=247480 RepID=UPI00188C318A|nr:hypothetical protein [Anoxybacillus caldiproteolyticus]QPA32225.1 hypothetical protein ISX45_04355 [Anoxybacillus caldiproteolyticus]
MERKQCKFRKLTEEQVQEIREQYATRKWTHRDLAKKYDVSEKTIGKAVKGIVKPKPFYIL